MRFGGLRMDNSSFFRLTNWKDSKGPLCTRNGDLISGRIVEFLTFFPATTRWSVLPESEMVITARDHRNYRAHDKKNYRTLYMFANTTDKTKPDGALPMLPM